MGRRLLWYLITTCTCLLGVALLASSIVKLRDVYPHAKDSTYVEARGKQHLTLRLRSSARLKFVNVVVVAPSAADWVDRRRLIRKQFPRNLELMNATSSAVLKFAVGIYNMSTESKEILEAEQRQHKDMLFLDCIDKDDDLNWQWNWRLDGNVSATTSKVMLTIGWAVQNFKFDYFFRLGDDSYFRIDKFVELIETGQIPKDKAVVGQILQTEILSMNQPYPQGMGYGLTYDVCAFVAAAMPWLLDTAPEDGVVARWLFAVGAAFVNLTTFRSIVDGEPCSDDMILAHKLPEDRWRKISETGTVDC